MLPAPLWTAFRLRITDEFKAGWLPAKHMLVAIAIANLNFAGDWSPTVAKIALEAGCSTRTVQRARVLLESRGLLAVRERFEIVDGRAQQRANGYFLAVPAGPVTPKPRGRQSGAPIQKNKKKEEENMLGKWLEKGQRDGFAALAARRAAIEARWRANYR